MGTITYIDEVSIEHKRVLLRVDFDVPLSENHTVVDDTRIKETLPTIRLLLQKHNKLIILAKLGRPKTRDSQFSLKPIAEKLQELLSKYTVTFIDDFLTENKSTFENQKENEILFFENMRFYPEEKACDEMFAKKIASLGDVYINDGFAVDHRNEATIVTVPKHLPSYGGLLLKNEVQALSKIVDNPKKPVVAIIGGAKISTKIMLIEKLLHLADSVILGGALASTFLLAKGYEVGQSLVEKDMVGEAKKLLALAKDMQKDLLLPVDVTGTTENSNEVIAKKADAITPDFSVFDIGQETEKIFRTCIEEANTIVWNGPVGLFEKKPFDNGTTAIFEAVITNAHAFSVVGGGDTLAAIEHKNGKEKITHISTGGGAMLDFVQNGTLPGLDAIRK